MNRAVLLAIARRIAPGVADLDPDGQACVLGAISRAIGARPLRLQRHLTLFINLVRWAPLVRYGRPFERLGPSRQDAVLRWFMDAPLARLRQGFWGVKTLVYMGYYGQPDIAGRVGYRPVRRGNDVLRAARGPSGPQG